MNSVNSLNCIEGRDLDAVFFFFRRRHKPKQPEKDHLPHFGWDISGLDVFDAQSRRLFQRIVRAPAPPSSWIARACFSGPTQVHSSELMSWRCPKPSKAIQSHPLISTPSHCSIPNHPWQNKEGCCRSLSGSRRIHSTCS